MPKTKKKKEEVVEDIAIVKPVLPKVQPSIVKIPETGIHADLIGIVKKVNEIIDRIN